jgi:Sugar (and other) transporter
LAHYLPESPIYLIKVGKYEQARGSLRMIAQINGVKLPKKITSYRFVEEIKTSIKQGKEVGESNN